MPEVMVALDLHPRLQQQWQYYVWRLKQARCCFWKIHDPLPGLTYKATVDHLRTSLPPGTYSRILWDNKEHDIPDRVVEAVRKAVYDVGFDWVTVHTHSGWDTLKALEKAKLNSHVIAVTMLTSQDDEFSRRMHLRPRDDMQCFLAQIAADYGVDGVVCSAPDVPLLRPIVGDKLFMTPGVYLPTQGRSSGQRMVATPAEAVGFGSDCLILGRSINGTQEKPIKKPWRQFVRAKWQVRDAVRKLAAA
jgi:orotidine 5'-phosphate decarboxylase subfamily 1